MIEMDKLAQAVVIMRIRIMLAFKIKTDKIAKIRMVKIAKIRIAKIASNAIINSAIIRTKMGNKMAKIKTDKAIFLKRPILHLPVLIKI